MRKSRFFSFLSEIFNMKRVGVFRGGKKKCLI